MKQNSARKSALSQQQFHISGKPDFDLTQQQLHLYNTIIGNYKYVASPWAEEDLQPDLVLTMKLPKDHYIQRNKFLSLSAYLSNPAPQLQAAFGKAEQQIMAEMTKQKEHADGTAIKIRLQRAIEKRQKRGKTLYYLNQSDQNQMVQIQCVHQKNKVLDAFTLQYNAIVYSLQKVCGFRVRSFLLYDQNIENQRIFLFLNLSPQNRIRVATKYKMKKEVDYSQIDFFLNDPCGVDGRPLKLHSSYKTSAAVVPHNKQTNRYFNVRDRFLETNGVIDEHDISFEQEDRFLMVKEETKAALSYYKKNGEPILTNHEKQYIFNYNNKKINRGCNIMYHKFTQRRQFFKIVKLVAEKYNFRSTEQPQIFENFILPGRYNKGAGFFQRLKGILLYKPQVVGPDGQVDLFLKMQKVKLAYLVLKKTFKMNFLQKIGFDVFAFGSDFQKTGKGFQRTGKGFQRTGKGFQRTGKGSGEKDEGGGEKDEGGVDGQNVADKWPVYGLFAKLSTIRNYFGDVVGHEICFKLYMFYFFAATAVPYTVLYILEQTFKAYIFLGSDVAKLLFIATLFRAYLTLWSLFQEKYVSQFQQEIPSKIFLNTYRGPYVRNVVTDQINEYQRQGGMLSAIKNIVCLLIISALLVVSGSIFYGCRMLLLSIYDRYASAKVSSISLPHLFAYLMFFVLMDLLRSLATDHIIDLLVLIRNPPSDEDSREYGHVFRFYYLLGIELIAPAFFLLIEPLQNTSCYSKNCNKEIQYYVYSRYLIKLGQVLFRFAKILVLKYSANLKEALVEERQAAEEESFEGRLSTLLVQAARQRERKQHKASNSFELIIIIGYALYSLLLPIVVMVSLASLLIELFVTRTSLLGQERRPINKSQSILRLSYQLHFIFAIGVIVNSWTMVFAFETVQTNFAVLIEVFLPQTSKDLVFFVKVVSAAVLSVVLFLLGEVAGKVTRWLAQSWILKRKNNKFNEFIMSEFTDKLKLNALEDRTPLKTLFRTWSPQQMPHQQLQKVLDNYAHLFGPVLERQEDAQTFSTFTRRP